MLQFVVDLHLRGRERWVLAVVAHVLEKASLKTLQERVYGGCSGFNPVLFVPAAGENLKNQHSERAEQLYFSTR